MPINSDGRRREKLLLQSMLVYLFLWRGELASPLKIKVYGRL